MDEKPKAYYCSPIGTLEIVGDADGITSVEFVDDAPRRANTPPELAECVSQLDEYFNGKRKTFSLNLVLGGTEFQNRVWRELLNIPFGRTVAYLDIARALGNRNAIRATGAANGQNPIVIIVPCHRVIGSDGSLTGYGGGLWRKEWLLNFERASAQTRLFDAG
jgi:methylated-DNA-[protein]-cysteine S-methyltransferase